MIVCVCSRVNDETIRRIARETNSSTIEELQFHIEVCAQCQCCEYCVRELLERSVAGECDGSTTGS